MRPILTAARPDNARPAIWFVAALMLAVGGPTLGHGALTLSVPQCASMTLAACALALAGLLGGAHLGAAMTVLAVACVLGVGGRACVLGWRTARAVRALARAEHVPFGLGQWAVPNGGVRIVVLAGTGRVAFCAGAWRPALYISVGAVEALSGAELDAVIAHERSHARRRDPLRALLRGATAEVLFFLPVVRWWHKSRGVAAELAADRAAISAAGVPALAGALLHLAGSGPAPAGAARFAPPDPPDGPSAIKARVDALAGHQPRIHGRAPLASTAAGLVGALIVTSLILCIGALTASGAL